MQLLVHANRGSSMKPAAPTSLMLRLRCRPKRSVNAQAGWGRRGACLQHAPLQLWPQRVEQLAELVLLALEAALGIRALPRKLLSSIRPKGQLNHPGVIGKTLIKMMSQTINAECRQPLQ
eukprot:531713-Pleurochrysis_carterae.AAC.4